MKKVCVLLILIISAFGSVYAQVELGVRAGLNFNSNSVGIASDGLNPIDVAGSKTGFHFGGYASFNLGLLSIQPEAYYSVQGSDITVEAVNGAINSNYLQVPVLVRLNFVKILNVHAGPQYGILLKNEMDIGDSVTDLRNQSKNGDFSFIVGAGLDLPSNLSITVRYVKGFTNLVDQTVSNGPEKMKNSMFQVSVGYALLGR